MRSSIRTKITFMVINFCAFILIASWIICNFFIEDIFVSNVKNNLKSTYESCNVFFSQNPNQNNYQTNDLYGSIYNPLDSTILIFDRKNVKIYTSINDESRIMESLNNAIRSMETADIISRNVYSNYVITKNHDEVINADYYDLVGRLDNGFSIIVRSPVSRIDSVVYVVKNVFIKVAVGLLIFGSMFILAFGNIFAAPIKSLCNVAKRMTHLDFDVKVSVITNDEIGELGNCMNEMSEKLESTISELKSANAKLKKDIEQKEQIDDMRKDFLSHVSHELKTPIALIQGYAEGLKYNLSDDMESREFYTDVIIDEAKKMNELVVKLLNLNELEFGQSTLSFERFELVDFIKNIIDASSILVEETEARVIFDEAAPVYVWADEFLIEEVFTNYFTNAIHHVKPGGDIRITFDRTEDNVRVFVFNQGEKIPDEDIDRLFDKFYKVDKARTREYGGSGIGLSIVAAAMKSHGKDYGVFNEEEGVVFYFDLDANMPC
ncbi:MAG: two-component sensor histidine kinase [Lachnospiraceae bacterium]|nr:two-component sensor histidine kinase [Lachnospiraceae bacterium]